MRHFRIGNINVYTTDRKKVDAAWDANCLMRGLFRRRKIFEKVVRAYAVSNRLPLRPHLFIAHGATRRGNHWYFGHSNRIATVQSWIDRYDGTAGMLFLYCCNRLNCEIHSSSSLIVHLNRSASRWDLFRGGCLRLYHPEYGYIENNYRRLHAIINE